MNDNPVGFCAIGLQGPARPGVLGDGITSTLSAAEALALVAFNDRRALSGRMQDFPHLWPNAAKLAKRWAEDIEEIMVTATALSDVTKRFDWRLARLADASVEAGTSSRDGADAWRVCRGAMFSARLRRADREWRTREEDVLSASNTLREAVSASAIKVLGKPGSRPRLRIESSNYEEIPASVFADPHRQIDPDGWLTMSRQTPLAILRAWRQAPRSDWADLRFQTTPSDLQRVLRGLLKVSAPPEVTAVHRLSFGEETEPATAEVSTLSAERRCASSPLVRQTINQIYDHAAAKGMKPPNSVELLSCVRKALALNGYCVGRGIYDNVLPESAGRRRRSGQRVNSSLTAFSLEGWEKTGIEG